MEGLSKKLAFLALEPVRAKFSKSAELAKSDRSRKFSDI
jgi:hypothetical protein